MNKKIFAAMVVMAALFVGYSTYDMPNEKKLTCFALANVEALANTEAPGGSTKDCPGGSCSHTFSNGEVCTACCPEGDRPECNIYGCTCW